MTTYATIGDQLWLDGNPFIRGLNWKQVIFLQIISVAVAVAAFLFVYKRQRAIWPDGHLSFLSFVKYRLGKGFSLNFSAQHFKTEDIYAGMLLIWVLILAHAVAGIINTIPLVGLPSFIEFSQLNGLTDLRAVQNAATALIIVFAIFLAHYPIYMKYTFSFEKKDK